MDMKVWAESDKLKTGMLMTQFCWPVPKHNCRSSWIDLSDGRKYSLLLNIDKTKV